MSDTSSTASDDDFPSDGDWDDWGGGGLASESAAAANADDDDINDDDFEETATASLFEKGVVLPSASAALAHDAAKHGFNLAEFKKKVKID